MIAGAAFLGALLAAAPPPVTDPRNRPEFLLQFTAGDSYARVTARLGPPVYIADLGGLRVWHYRIGPSGDTFDYSHTVCFDPRDGALLSVTRTFQTDEDVDTLFPKGAYSVHYWRDEGRPPFGVRVRVVSGGLLLIALGSPEAGVPTSQLMLIRRPALERFLPWLAAQLAGTRKAPAQPR